MDDIDFIKGPQVLDLIRQVHEKRTLVRLTMRRHALSALTLINDVGTASPPLFLVDVIEGLHEAMEGDDQAFFSFEFTGKEGVLYRFDVQGGQLAAEGLWLPVPKFLERIQRRKDFRLTVLPGTRILYQTDAAQGVIKVIDISMGGSLGALVRIRADGRAGDFFKVGGILTDLHLEIPLGAQSQRVRIEKASIRRIEKPPDAARPRCALQFLEIAPDQKKVLVKAVYALQRIYLKNRRR